MLGWKKKLSPEDQLSTYLQAHRGQKVKVYGMADAPHIGHMLGYRSHSTEQEFVTSPPVGTFHEAEAWMSEFDNFQLKGFVIAS